MKRLFTILFCCLVQLGFTQSAADIVKRMDEKMRGNSSQAEMIIRTVRPTWSREMQVKTWMKGTKFAMILIQSPVKEKGIVFLKRKKEVWNWMPALERTIKLPPSMMANSWMGTDFSNDDLVRESSVVEDYIHSFIGDTVIDKQPCYLIKMVPKPSTAVVWGKIIISIDKTNYLERYSEFYDEEGVLVNTMIAKEIKTMDGRLIPTHITMIPADKKNNRTEIIYKSIYFNKNIEDNFFSVERIKQIN